MVAPVVSQTKTAPLITFKRLVILFGALVLVYVLLIAVNSPPFLINLYGVMPMWGIAYISARLAAWKRREHRQAMFVTMSIMSIVQGVIAFLGSLFIFHLIDLNSAELFGYQLEQHFADVLMLIVPLVLASICGRASSWHLHSGHQKRFALLSVMTVMMTIVFVGAVMTILHS